MNPRPIQKKKMKEKAKTNTIRILSIVLQYSIKKQQLFAVIYSRAALIAFANYFLFRILITYLATNR